MVRILIIIALLATLFYLVNHLQPVVEPRATGKEAVSQQDKPPEEIPVDDPGGFNPVVATPLPDVNKGYIFSEKREIEKDVPGGAGKMAHQAEQGPDLLASVVYSGSLIAGNLRRALVVYQGAPKEVAPRRLSSGRTQATSASSSVMQKKQLNQGDQFLGYVVTVIEPDRIVFEKGDRKVQKFLYDRDKQRMAPPQPSPQGVPSAETARVPIEAMAPPEVLEALMAAPPARRPDSGAVGGATRMATPAEVPRDAMAPSALPPSRRAASGAVVGAMTPRNGTAAGGATGGTQAPATRVLRRSQRLLGLDPSITVPTIPVPGLPVPNK